MTPRSDPLCSFGIASAPQLTCSVSRREERLTSSGRVAKCTNKLGRPSSRPRVPACFSIGSIGSRNGSTPGVEPRRRIRSSAFACASRLTCGGGCNLILTGHEIQREHARGRLVIEPFVPEHLNPNSYNFRLGNTLRCYSGAVLDSRAENKFVEITITDEGFELEPGRLYLGHTIEVLGSDWYAPTFAARSSVARLGLFINLSASLGDIGYKGQWTLQLYSMNRVRVYPGMNIGQMMWWLPQGEIQLYDGKYQGADGPKSSAIHLDYRKQIVRQQFPSLGASVDASECGHKFAEISPLAAAFSVPRGFCIPAEEFRSALSPKQRGQLESEFVDIKATIGAFLGDSAESLESIARGIRVSPAMKSALAMRLSDMFEASDVEFAVRSSGLDEDTEMSSLAGIHQTVLGVRGVDDVVAAVQECWRSYYGLPAVAGRVRNGDLGWEPRLALFVQEMIRPDISGVAFTGLGGPDDEEVTIEYVHGLADRLVAGEVVPSRYRSSQSGVPEDSFATVLAEVERVARELTTRLGHHVDIEWAADDQGVHLIQVRPLTASLTREVSSPTPVVESCRLYFDEVPATFALGAVASVYSGYAAKRGPAHRLAHTLGITVGGGHVLRFNGRGLHDLDARTRLEAALASTVSSECVLDLGDTLRQIVVPKSDVADWLIRTTASDRDSSMIHSAVVRDFVAGDGGFISRRVDEGLVIEFAREGLLALNRGTAAPEVIIVEDVSDLGAVVAPADAAVIVENLSQIVEMTTQMEARYGAVALEWVQAHGDTYFTDYSVLGGGGVLHTASAGLLISPGSAEGPLISIDDEALLERLSVGPAVSIDRSHDVTGHDGLARIIERVKAFDDKPIVLARRPYAVLSVLIGDVAGFVFEEGSVLCHLAILLREAGVPAVASQGTCGRRAVISDGAVTTTD